MFETNTQNNSALISLSRAAQLTGYHQDYLGQLCRLGKLRATKIGRNWFTSPEALNKLSTLAEVERAMNLDAPVESTQSTETEATNEIELSQPAIIHTVTVSQVEDMPVAIRTIPSQGRAINSVQNILTAIRIETLQREVSELREMLARLMTEVAGHSKILQSRSSSLSATAADLQRADQLKHSYISNFDFTAPYSRMNIMKQDDEVGEETMPQSWAPEPEPAYSIVAWVTATAVAVVIAAMGTTMLTGQFFGPTEPQVTTVYHHLKPPHTNLEPTVAGETLPTDAVGTQP